MTAETDLDRRARRIRVMAQQITVALAQRPGALPPAETDDALELLNRLARACPTIQYAPADRQLTIAESFLRNWLATLSDHADLLDQAAVCWPDADDESE